MRDGALRRTVLVLLAYAAGAWLVLALGDWLRRVLVLPLSFDELLRWGLYLGAVVAALVAWFYPSLGLAGAAIDTPEHTGATEQAGTKGHAGREERRDGR